MDFNYFDFFFSIVLNINDNVNIYKEILCRGVRVWVEIN